MKNLNKKIVSFILLVLSMISFTSTCFSVYYDKNIFNNAYHELSAYPTWFLIWSIGSILSSIAFIIISIALIHKFIITNNVETNRKSIKITLKANLIVIAISFLGMILFSILRFNGKPIYPLLGFIIPFGVAVPSVVYLGYLLFITKVEA